MKKTILMLVAIMLLIVFTGCAAQVKPNVPNKSNEEPNVWVVTKEAPVLDSEGKEAGKAFAGFMISLQNEKNGSVYFTLSFMDDNGENVKETKEYTIDTKYMNKKYVEPQAVIMMISTDMITIKPGSTLYNAQGEKLITFHSEIGPFFFIQYTDMGYMMTIDYNVVFAKKDDATLIKLSL